MESLSGIENKVFSVGEVIFNEGDSPDGVYFILDGEVEISRSELNNTVILGKMGPESVFGEMSLIDGQPRSATVKALKVTECLKGSSTKFNNLINNIDSDVKNAMKQIVSVIRRKNLAYKANMSNVDANLFNAVQKQAAGLKAQIVNNKTLVIKIKKMDPLIYSIFNSLLKLLIK